uniref:Ig-like domain-containing protein n=1 Tax=Scleropages formosus TaxID=113540 RepID=A0A8C9W4D7_SCLFO
MEEQLFKYIHTLFILTPLVFGEMYRRPKEGVSLTPALKGPFEELLWKYNENKVAEYRAGDGINVFGQFKGRATLNTKTGQLMVRDLRKADSGRYTAEVLMSGTMQDSSFDVKVIDAVTRPTVQCEQRDSVGILRCHSEGEMGQYRWEGPNDLLRNWTDQPIELQVSSSDSAYTCVVKNPVSEESSETFPAEHCFKGLFAHHGAVAAVVILVSVVLSVSGFLIGAHCMRRNSRRNGLRCDHVGKKDEETGLLQHYEVTEKNRELCSQNPSEDDGKTVGHIDSPAETQEKEGEKVAEVEEKVENRVSDTNTCLMAQNTPMDESKGLEDSEAAAAAASEEKEGKKGKNKKSRGIFAIRKPKKRNESAPVRNTSSCGQNTSEDDKKTEGHMDSPAEIIKKEGGKAADEKQENRVPDSTQMSADTSFVEDRPANKSNEGKGMKQNIPEERDTNTCLMAQNTPMDESKGLEDSETAAAAAASEEKEGKKGKNKKSRGIFPIRKPKKRNESAPVRNTSSCGQNTSEDDKKTEGHMDSPAEVIKKEGGKVADEKQESKVSETSTDRLSHNNSMGENKRPEDNESTTAPNEKEGKKMKKNKKKEKKSKK